MYSVDSATGCWEWLGRRNSSGYGMLGRRGAHRLVYTLLKGDIPDGLQLDHLCRNRGCVNPDHLDPVTQKVNILRGVGATAQHARATHCPEGHPYEGDNLRVHTQGFRRCRACTARHQREYQERKRARERELASLD